MSEEAAVDTGTESAAQVDDSAAVAAAVEGTQTTTEATADGWMFAEGVAGEGDVPEWFKGDKYKTVSAQAEAYKDLEGKFGSFTGAPDEFTVAVSDELKEKGVDISAEHPLVASALEFAKDSNMNQEGFSKMMNLVGMYELANQEAQESFRADELKALGDNAQSRVDNIAKWGQANLDENLFGGLADMVKTSESVKTIERLISMTRSAPMSPDNVQVPSPVSSAEVMAMQFEEDKYGNRRINTDAAFRAEYEKKKAQAWGSEDHIEIVGG